MTRILCFLFCSILMGQAWAACSSYKGLATINEIYERSNGTHFIEVKLLAASLTSADYNSWTLRACRRTNVCSSALSLSGATRSDAWLVLNNVGATNIDLNGGMDVILRDSSGNTVDYMTMENYTPQRDNTCTSSYDWQHSDSINNTDNVYRNADGVGNWTSTPGNSSQETQGADNSQSLPFGAPQLSVNNVAAEQGTALVFTFTLSATFSSAVSITYQTVNDTALSGTHYTSTSGTVTIPAGSTTATVSVPTIDSTETNSVRMFMQISSATNASVIGAIGIGTILNNNFVADWRMDEASWNGITNEAVDSSGNGYHGTAARAAGSTALPTTASVSSAYTSGSQSTCAYGQFDTSASPTRTNGYLSINGAPALNSSFTFTAWIRSTNASRSGQRILVRDDAQNGWGFSLGDPGSARVRFFNRNIGASANLTGNGSLACGGTTFCLDTAPVITANNWFYVAVAIDTSARRITHYVFNQAGTLLSNTSATFPNAWVDGSGTLAIGGETIASDEGRTDSFHFNGNIDELRIVSGAMSQSTVEDMLERTRPCSGNVVVDHYHISHSGNGITCEAEPVTITAHDASHNPVNVTSNTSLTVTTDTAVTAIVSSPVTIAAGSSSATVNIQQLSPLSNIDIDVVDGAGRTEVDGGGDHDPALTFADTGLRFYADGVISSIGHQIMNKPSSSAPSAQTLTLRALRTNDATMACEAAVSGTHDVDFGFACLNPATCSASGTLDVVGNSSVSVAGSNGAAAVTATVPMTFDASGVATFSFDANDTGRMQLLASLTVTPVAPDPTFTLTGYSNIFAVRPFGFDIDFPPYDPDDPLYQRAADFVDDGLLNNSTELDPIDPFDGNLSWARNANGSVFTQAGVAFTTRLRAVGWESEDDEDENGEPDLDDRTTVADETANLTDNSPALSFAPDLGEQNVELSHDLILPPPPPTDLGVLGTLGGSTTLSNALFVNGVATLQPSWSEVGIIDLTADLTNYLGVSNLNITGTAQNVGRFIPAQFSVTATNGEFINACGSFTYIGQPFKYGATTVPSLTITAQNASGGTTQNYTSAGFQKLSDVHVYRECPGDTVAVTDGVHIVHPCADTILPSLSVQPFNDSDNDGALDSGEASNSTSVFSNALNGVMTYHFNTSDAFLYTKNAASRIGPFDSELFFEVEKVLDSDSVSAADVAQVPPDPDDLSGEPLRFSPDVTPSLRYGRLRMENAYGPEIFGLRIPMRAEFYNGTEFELNNLDNCTAYDASDLILTFDPSVLSTSATGTGSLETGVAPTESLADGADKRIELSAPGADNVGTVALCLNVDDWMKFDWGNTGVLNLALTCGTAGDANPKATATFGQYRGHDRIIYWREVED